ncbi:ATP-binding cassette domain-containing protein [Geoglobus ahangari]
MERYYYPSGVLAISGVEGVIEDSCFISGATGSGKSTLLRTFNGMIPDFYGGEFAGRVRVFGEKPSPKTAYLIMQNPAEQVTCLKVEDELIFPAVQLGASIRDARIDARELAEEIGVAHLLDRMTFELSTGELQIVEILSAMLSGRRVVLMDEPFAHLSRRNVERLLKLLEDTFVIVSDHRIEFSERFPERLDFGMRIDELPEIRGDVGDVVFQGSVVLREGELVAVVGDNGAGKTTLLKRVSEEMRRQGIAHGISLQNPSYHLTSRTVLEEVGSGELIREFGLEGLEGRHPQSLSQGQMRRVSLARAFRHDILLLDEPTAGQDVNFRNRLVYLLRKYRKAALIATHDESLAEKCDRVVEL